MALPPALQGDTWAKVTARRAFPVLVWCAQNDQRITYKELDAELQRLKLGRHAMAVAYGHAAGKVNAACMEIAGEMGEKVPPLSAILVNARTGIPGIGPDEHFKRYLKNIRQEKLTHEDRRSIAEEVAKEVFHFEKWDKVMELLGLEPLRGGVPALRSERVPRPPRKSGWAVGPESEEHKALKAWVAVHPDVLMSRIPFGFGQPEYLFASNDRADVMFEHDKGCMAVEVKAANAGDAELERGIYQCVKYRALLRAELKAEGRVPNGSCLLVTEGKLSPDLQELAALLEVRVLVAPARRDKPQP